MDILGCPGWGAHWRVVAHVAGHGLFMSGPKNGPPKWSRLFGASSRSTVHLRITLALKMTRTLVPKWDAVQK